MASSKLMPSASPPNPDLPRHSTSSSSTSISHPASHTPTPPPPAVLQQPPRAHHLLHSDHSISSFGTMTMEEILKNIYSETDPLASAVDGGALSGVSAVDGGGMVGSKTVNEVWKEIVGGGGGGGGGGGEGGGGVGSDDPGMTLEDFLTKAGAVSEEDVRAPPPGGGGYGVEVMMNAAAAGVQFPGAPVPVVHMHNGPGAYVMESQVGIGSGMMAAAAATGTIRGGRGGSGGGSARGKRRAPPVEEVALDRATQQKQRRMIKNRESAARSRERKQAYTVELESLVTHLEEENARLLRIQAEQNKERYKQLMENLIPVGEKPRPRRVLRRVQSMSW